MGRRCQVCDSPERAKVEMGLARKVSVPQLSRKFDLHKDALYRHRDSHMPPQLKASLMAAGRPTEIDLDALRKSESEGILQHLVAERGRLYRVADEAERLGDLRAAVQAHRAVNDNIQTTAKLLGELATGSTTTVNNLVVAPEYVHLRSALIRALHPFPEARRAVAQVLKEVEGTEPEFTGAPRQIEHEAGANGHAGS
ncbi:hypothetical protein [Ferruginivarius sediminum]|uniref:Uncharacterized protein n=1 Tax=Ferruginivarius sediminum TaxID=2661937 RepID=A0A369TBC4_9PROT|nr:hypothetical protein [Ferruginivarius sediminum]RDD62623.1 hypothetical protein DRB17_05535 [Ferruginivarius sediminum]